MGFREICEVREVDETSARHRLRSPQEERYEAICARAREIEEMMAAPPVEDVFKALGIDPAAIGAAILARAEEAKKEEK